MKLKILSLVLIGVSLSLSSCWCPPPDKPVDEGMNKPSGFNVSPKGTYNSLFNATQCTSWNNYTETVSSLIALEYSCFYVQLHFLVGNHKVKDLTYANEIDAYFNSSVTVYSGVTYKQIPVTIDSILQNNWIIKWDVNYCIPSAGSVHTNTSEANKYTSYVSMNTILMQEKYGKRSETFTNFPIFLENKGNFDVHNSEELWWAVEHNYLPNFPTQDSRAEYYWNEALDICRNNIRDDMSDLEKIDTLYSFVATNIKYDFDSLNYNNDWRYNTAYFLEGSFSYNYAVCDSLSKMVALLCGIENLDVYRGAGFCQVNNKTEGHAWNYASLDGGNTYHIVCPTWGRLYNGEDFGGHRVNVVDRDGFMAKKSYFKATSQGVYDFSDNLYFEDNRALLNYDVFKNETFIVENKTYDFTFNNVAKFNILAKAIAASGTQRNYSLQIEKEGALILMRTDDIAAALSYALKEQGCFSEFYYWASDNNRQNIFNVIVF